MPNQDCQPYLPPEWAPQSGVMLTWPHDQGDWSQRLTEVEPVFVEIARHIASEEIVLIVCRDHAHKAHVGNLLQTAGISQDSTRLAIAPSNDTWARDHGPLTVVCRQQPLMLDFQFNGWGNKYPSDQDNAINRILSMANVFGDTPMETVDMVLEGGSLEVDGSGTLLTTEHCLLSPTRNPNLSREEIEQRLAERFGIERFLWLNRGQLEGDDTDGHIDTLARFCDRDTIAYQSCDDPADNHYLELQVMEQELQAFRTITGDPYRLVALPWPRAIYNDEGERLPATYANFLIINNKVLVPTYRDANDDKALERLRPCFPDRQIIGIDCLPIVHQYGSLHCLTMQLPAGVISG
ncbi:MAG: agmatine deiminase family protein [Gammaproteobacteria bacterium]|nr:agmatine deiminase family protein [Gammaproteobacteria bacterium]